MEALRARWAASQAGMVRKLGLERGGVGGERRAGESSGGVMADESATPRVGELPRSGQPSGLGQLPGAGAGGRGVGSAGWKVRRWWRAWAESGAVGPGDPVPGERAVARALGVSRSAVAGAMARLEAEGKVTPGERGQRRTLAGE